MIAGTYCYWLSMLANALLPLYPNGRTCFLFYGLKGIGFSTVFGVVTIKFFRYAQLAKEKVSNVTKFTDQALYKALTGSIASTVFFSLLAPLLFHGEIHWSFITGDQGGLMPVCQPIPWVQFNEGIALTITAIGIWKTQTIGVPFDERSWM